MIREALGEFAATAARAFEAREQTVGASDVGRCARRKKFGERLRFADEQQETFAVGFLSATPDGLLIAWEDDALAALGVPSLGGDGSIVLECKTIDPRTRLEGPRLVHAYQAQVQLGLIHAFTRYRPGWAVISYTDASFWDTIYEYPVRRDPRIFETAQRRAAQILTARVATELPPEGWIAGGRECARCAFSRACGNVRATVPAQVVEPSPEFVAEIVKLARQTKQREAELDRAVTAHRAAQQDLKDRLSANNIRRVNGDGVRLTWSAVKGRPSYDMRAIREAAAAAGVDLTQFETTGQASDRLDIRIAGWRSDQ